MADFPITYFIDLNLSTQLGAIAGTTFSIPLILTDEGTYDDSDKVRTYTSIESVAEDWATSTDAYKKAADMFAQEVPPDTIKIATCETYVAQVQTITFSGDIVTGNTVTAEIDGETLTQAFDTDHLTTITALAAQIAALDGVSTATVGGSGNRVITVTAQTTGVPVDIDSVAVTGGASQATAAILTTVENQGPVDDLTTLITDHDDNFYFVLYTDETLARVKVLAAYVQTLDKIFVTKTNAAEALDSGDSTDIGSVIKASSYYNTGVFYSDDSDHQADACLIGWFASKEPGSVGLNGKTFIGLVADDLTQTQQAALATKYYLQYGTIGDTSVLRDPPRSDGMYLDQVRDKHAFKAKIQLDMLNFLFAQKKIPYTEDGISQVLSALKASLEESVADGLIASYDEPTAPTLSSISAINKANRYLPDIEVVAYAAGAIYKITINATLTQS